MKIFNLIFLLLILLGSCSREGLSTNSVTDSNIPINNRTELDKWIHDSITIPYGIAVEYRWNGNSVPRGSHVYPPNPTKVKAVLEAIKYLWLETYELPSLGKKDFLKGKNPIILRMYGGSNIDEKGISLLDNPSSTGAEMHIYNVDNFDPKNENQVFLLMRSVHHQFAKRLSEIIPYDRDTFLAISQTKYLASTDDIAEVKENFSSPIAMLKLSDYANKRGFYTIHGMISAEDDFAEIISATLTHTPKEISDAEKNAQTPFQDYGSDPSVQQQYDENAKVSYAQLMAKKNVIYNYFNKNLKINLKRMQLISIERMKAYKG